MLHGLDTYYASYGERFQVAVVNMQGASAPQRLPHDHRR